VGDAAVTSAQMRGLLKRCTMGGRYSHSLFHVTGMHNRMLGSR
jgi:hypothetical protein